MTDVERDANPAAPELLPGAAGARVAEDLDDGPVDPHVGPLPASGGWAEVRTSITYGVRRAMQIALLHRRDPDATVSTNWEAEVIVAMVVSWSLTEADGSARPITLEGVSRVDARDVDAIFDRASAAYRAGLRPLDPKAEPRS